MLQHGLDVLFGCIRRVPSLACKGLALRLDPAKQALIHRFLHAPHRSNACQCLLRYSTANWLQIKHHLVLGHVLQDFNAQRLQR